MRLVTFPHSIEMYRRQFGEAAFIYFISRLYEGRDDAMHGVGYKAAQGGVFAVELP